MAADNSNLIIYEIKQDQSIEKVEFEEFLDFRVDTDRLFFIQALSADIEYLSYWLSRIGADPLVHERCIDTVTTSGVYAYGKMFVLQLPVAYDWVSSDHPKLTVICMENTLVCVSEQELLFSRHSGMDEPLHSISKQASVSEMLFVILDQLIDHSSDLTLQARLAVDKLENKMLIDIHSRYETQLLSYKRSIAHFEMALESKHRTLTGLLSSDAAQLDFTKIREPLRDVIAHVEHSQRYVERIEDRLVELQSHITLMLQGKTNLRLRILTVLSAIFMPLTLIAGIYGMNFRNMPELSWHDGYFLVLFTMLGIAIGLLIYFAQKGWFK